MQGPDKGKLYVLLESENILGRQSKSVQLNDGTVSRSHARISPRDDGKWMLEDMGSANGTYLNGMRLGRPSPLKRGDQIRVGGTLLVFGGGRDGAAAAGFNGGNGVDVDEDGLLVDAAIVATVPSNEDSVIIPTPEAGREAIGNLRILYDLISDIGSTFNVDLLLERTLEKVFEVVKADRGYIMLQDGGGKLVPKVSRILREEMSKQLPVSRTIINEVFSKQVGVLSTNAMSDKRFAAGKSVHDFGIRSALCVPIKGHQKILGVIHVDCGMSEHTYSTEQLRLLTAIGYQTGLAIENVRLHESRVQAERLTAVGETVAFLSHHIKNILQALSSGIDVVEMGLNRGDLAKSKQSWPIVQRNLGRINELILNMLAFSKNRDPLLENVNLNALLIDCIELVTPKADERNVVLLNELEDLPEIPADSGGLNQAFLNLLNNALEAVPNNTGIITLTSRYNSLDRTVVVRIIDNGTGISPDEIGQIFTPFYSSKGQRGTGLGLTVAQKLIREHHGTIEVASKLAEGTTFTVTLPAIRVDDPNDTLMPGPGKGSVN